MINDVINKIHKDKVKSIKQEFKDKDETLSAILKSLGISKEEFLKSFDKVSK